MLQNLAIFPLVCQQIVDCFAGTLHGAQTQKLGGVLTGCNYDERYASGICWQNIIPRLFISDIIIPILLKTLKFSSNVLS